MNFKLGEEFGLSLGNVPEEHKLNIEKWFKIEPVKNTLDNLLDELIYRVTFQPMKPF